MGQGPLVAHDHVILPCQFFQVTALLSSQLFFVAFTFLTGHLVVVTFPMTHAR